jgi:ribosomal-protein-alanine N-acetyltransferase
VISIPRVRDAKELLAYAQRNFDHHAAWSPPPPRLPLTEDLYRELIAQSWSSFSAGTSVRFWLRLAPEFAGPFVGAVSLSQIFLRAFRACYLGYHVDQAYEGQGYMTEAVGAVIQYAFEALRLHRIMANYMPRNARSARLLERLGFEREGLARDYLFIGNQWEDHVLTALTNRALADAAELVRSPQ